MDEPRQDSKNARHWLHWAFVAAVLAISQAALAYFFPAWPGTWLLAVGLVTFVVILYFHPGGFYRRMATTALGLAAASSSLPSIVAYFQIDPIGKGAFLVEASPLLGFSCVLLAGFLCWIDHRARLSPNEVHPSDDIATNIGLEAAGYLQAIRATQRRPDWDAEELSNEDYARVCPVRYQLQRAHTAAPGPQQSAQQYSIASDIRSERVVDFARRLLYDRLHNVHVILGEPSGGKSTLAVQVMEQLSGDSFSHIRLPVYVNLQHFQSAAILSELELLVAAAVDSGCPRFVHPTAINAKYHDYSKNLLDQNVRWLFIFDAMDEMPVNSQGEYSRRVDALVAFMRKNHTSTFLVTCRYTDFVELKARRAVAELRVQRYDLLSWTRKEVECYLKFIPVDKERKQLIYRELRNAGELSPVEVRFLSKSSSGAAGRRMSLWRQYVNERLHEVATRSEHQTADNISRTLTQLAICHARLADWRTLDDADFSGAIAAGLINSSDGNPQFVVRPIYSYFLAMAFDAWLRSDHRLPSVCDIGNDNLIEVWEFLTDIWADILPQDNLWVAMVEASLQYENSKREDAAILRQLGDRVTAITRFMSIQVLDRFPALCAALGRAVSVLIHSGDAVEARRCLEAINRSPALITTVDVQRVFNMALESEVADLRTWATQTMSTTPGAIRRHPVLWLRLLLSNLDSDQFIQNIRCIVGHRVRSSNWGIRTVADALALGACVLLGVLWVTVLFVAVLLFGIMLPEIHIRAHTVLFVHRELTSDCTVPLEAIAVLAAVCGAALIGARRLLCYLRKTRMLSFPAYPYILREGAAVAMASSPLLLLTSAAVIENSLLGMLTGLLAVGMISTLGLLAFLAVRGKGWRTLMKGTLSHKSTILRLLAILGVLAILLLVGSIVPFIGVIARFAIGAIFVALIVGVPVCVVLWLRHRGNGMAAILLKSDTRGTNLLSFQPNAPKNKPSTLDKVIVRIIVKLHNVMLSRWKWLLFLVPLCFVNVNLDLAIFLGILAPIVWAGVVWAANLIELRAIVRDLRSATYSASDEVLCSRLVAKIGDSQEPNAFRDAYVDVLRGLRFNQPMLQQIEQLAQHLQQLGDAQLLNRIAGMVLEARHEVIKDQVLE